MSTNNNFQIIEADLSIAEHAEPFLRLTAAYMADPMGQETPWSDKQKADVLQEMKTHPCAVILLAKLGDEFVGLCTCFYAYSTFLAKPLLNIHDIYVEEAHRSKGAAKMLIQKLEEIALEKNCGKITLEVRKDNLNARDLYRNKGFTEAPHSMFFWIKYL